MAPVKKVTIPRPKGKRTIAQKLERRDAWVALSKDVGDAQEDYADLAKQLAVKHNRSVSWTRGQLYLGSRKGLKQRKPIAWNGFISKEMSIANALLLGPKWNLPAYTAKHKEELHVKYNRLSEEEKQGYRDEVEDMRAKKATMARHNAKAVRKDVDNTFAAFKREFHAVEQRTGCKVFYLMVRGDVEHHNEPKIYIGPETTRFFKEVLNITPEKLAMQYEAFIVGGSQGVVKVHKTAMNDDISECRTLIAEALDLILKEHEIPTNVKTAGKLMNYENYEKKVVEFYGVELRGWPCAGFKNPGKLRRDELNLLLVELGAKRCRWAKLSEGELLLRKETNATRHRAGEAVYKARKQPNDKAVTPGVEV